VIEVVLDRLAYGWSTEEIHFQHPGRSLAQIHAALAYYYDHQVELDEEIARQEEQVRSIRQRAPDSPLILRLKARGLLR
jgi:diaminopimelate decarboxylase